MGTDKPNEVRRNSVQIALFGERNAKFGKRDSLDGDSIARLIYLALLLAAVSGWIFTSMRTNLTRLVQQLSVWAFIFIGVIAVYGLWDDVRRDVAPKRASFENSQILIPKSNDGHYYLTLEVNGFPVTFLLDTGATSVVLSQSDARSVGLNPNSLVYRGYARTANGEVRTAPVKLTTVAAGDLEFTSVRAWVSDGDLDISLLGQSFLSRFNKIEIRADVMTLEI